MAAGMKDVASLAGVAVGTVSNVLNHPDLVRPLTRARVEAAMEQLGFIPNGSARQLRAGRSRCLGLVVLDVTNPFFTEVARGVEDYAQAAGYAVILCNSDEADDKERRYLRVLEEQRVRGILITPVHGRAPELRRIRERGTPVVLLDRPGSAGQCSVAVDDRRGGEIAVSHLLGLGHRRIALVNGPVAIRQCADRRRGALRAVERAGLDPAAVLTEVTVPAMNARAGAAAADELLGRGPRPTAVFCTNDMLALGLLRRLGQAGRGGTRGPRRSRLRRHRIRRRRRGPADLGAPAQVPARPGRRRAPARRGRPARPARAPPHRVQARTSRAGQQRRSRQPGG